MSWQRSVGETWKPRRMLHSTEWKYLIPETVRVPTSSYTCLINYSLGKSHTHHVCWRGGVSLAEIKKIRLSAWQGYIYNAFMTSQTCKVSLLKEKTSVWNGLVDQQPRQGEEGSILKKRCYRSRQLTGCSEYPVYTILSLVGQSDFKERLEQSRNLDFCHLTAVPSWQLYS